MNRSCILPGFILFPFMAFPQWTRQNPLPQGNSLASVFFIDAFRGFTVGENGASIMTSGGSTTWADSPNTTSRTLTSVCFTDANNGIAVGFGTIQKTVNGGAGWEPVPCNSGWNLYSVCFPDVNTGYVTRDYGTILKTTNGGGVSIDEITPVKPGFIIYPNPATTKVTVSNSRELKGECRISIVDLDGQQLLEYRSANHKPIELDISQLAPGIFFLRIQTTEGVEVKKLVIR